MSPGGPFKLYSICMFIYRQKKTGLHSKSKRNVGLRFGTQEVRRLLIKINSSDPGLIFLRLSQGKSWNSEDSSHYEGGLCVQCDNYLL